MKPLIAACLCLFVIHGFAQENKTINISSEKKFGVGGQLLGPTKLLSAFFDYQVNQHVCIEVGAGAIGFYGGLDYFLIKKDRRANWAPYTGIFYTRAEAVVDDCNCAFGTNTFGMRSGVYVPLGIQHIANNGFSLALEFAGFYKFNAKTNFNPWGSLKMGYYF